MIYLGFSCLLEQHKGLPRLARCSHAGKPHACRHPQFDAALLMNADGYLRRTGDQKLLDQKLLVLQRDEQPAFNSDGVRGRRIERGRRVVSASFATIGFRC